jgi:hypothetical protein
MTWQLRRGEGGLAISVCVYLWTRADMQSAFDILCERLDRLGDSESASQREASSP